MVEEKQHESPVVFISYSHDSPQHLDRVLTLSNRLREDAVDCILDQYEDSPPEGWPRWTEKQIHEADFVLVICTETYYKRVMGEEKPGAGQGVRWEGNVIYQLIYDADAKNPKFLPILFADGQASHIPTPLKGATRYFVDTPEGYELLYRRLTNQPRAQKPELGKLRKLLSVEPRERKPDFLGAVYGSWPGVSPPRGGPKVTEPFAGREEELMELTAAMGGHKKVVAVVGMAGQGKSCLIGEWYKRGARPPQGVGLFWRKVYEAGYTFDRFVDDLHLYLSGKPIDRMQIKTIRDRATLVESLLATKPSWIVLDGVERWLRRWTKNPDADADNLTADDRAGHDPIFDEFLRGASFWENGSRLLLTTHAVPSTLDENLPEMIGHNRGHDRRLTDLKREEAIGLLDDLGVMGTETDKREAVTAYGCHAYAVHVLGILIRDLYGGDASRWRELKPLKEDKLAGLFERVIETCKEDVPLLELVACSLGPAPVPMLVELSTRDETSVRKSLVGLKKWQMVEFDGSEAEQHAVVRKSLAERLGRDGARAAQKRIAAWWARQKTCAKPTQIEEIRPLLRAVEHFAAAGDAKSAGLLFLGRVVLEGHYTISAWLQAFGFLDEDIRITGLLIETYTDVIRHQGRRELRRDLAACYSNRAIALQIQGHLVEAIADHARAVDIARRLIDAEGGHENRTALVGYYSNRSTAFRIQGRLREAMADLDHAIEIAKRLVEREGQRQLRKDLATCYNNRGNVFQAWGRLPEAIADYGRAIEIAERLVMEGRGDLREQLATCYSNRGTVLVVHHIWICG
jgi:tetratricopeptide (TPR) repeat protein